MTFEEALRYELTQIAELQDKVFPANAPEGTLPPYVIYLSQDGREIKCLDGFTGAKELNYEINIIQKTYFGLKTLSSQVLAKLKSFALRNIGDNGPYIQDITITGPVEMYESEIEAYRAYYEIKINL